MLFDRECEILSRLRHPVILGIIGFVLPYLDELGNCFGHIVTELLPRSLEQALTGTLTPTAKMKIALGIAKGMAYTHACGVVHRDLRPANILLDVRCEPRIADYGIAKVMEAEQFTQTESRGTVLYMAPDTIPGPPGDITGKRLVDEIGALPWTRLFMRRTKGAAMPKLDSLNENAKCLLVDCWKLEPLVEPTPPAPRPPFSAIVERMCECSYALLDGVDVNEINDYLAKINAFEMEFPAQSLDEDD
jgi:serine/threonine protein kinase